MSAACGQPIIGGTAVEPQSITVPWKELTDTDGVRLRYSGGKWEVHATFYVPASTLILLAAATVVMAALGLLSRPLRGG